MTTQQPDDAARWLSHLLVGAFTGAALGSKTGPAGFAIGFIGGMVIHDLLDAPVAGLLSEMGV